MVQWLEEVLSVRTFWEGAASAGPISPPFPTGTVLGATEGGFDIYIVPKDSPPLKTAHPQWSVLDEIQDVTLLLASPKEQQGAVHLTIGIPGHQLDSGTVDLINGWAKVVYAPLALRTTFPNIDVHGRTGVFPGLTDTVWINVFLEADGGGFYARQFTLQGPDLLIPPQETE